MYQKSSEDLIVFSKIQLRKREYIGPLKSDGQIALLSGAKCIQRTDEVRRARTVSPHISSLNTKRPVVSQDSTVTYREDNRNTHQTIQPQT